MKVTNSNSFTITDDGVEINDNTQTTPRPQVCTGFNSDARELAGNTPRVYARCRPV